MAIIPQLSRVVVDIVVDGKPLSEYLDEDDDEAISSNSITKYVECKSGSHFAIRTNVSGREHHYLQGGNGVEIIYYLDDKYADSNVMRDPWVYNGFKLHSTARYVEGATWKERKFTFADLVTCLSTAGSLPIIADTISS
jgi:hypothetical protein